MLANKENSWLECFVRECGLRRSVILHGNIGDLCYESDTMGYRPTMEVGIGLLKKKGFDEVILWDRFSGVQNVSGQVVEELEQATVQAQGAVPSQGEDYDCGRNEANPVGSPQQPAQQGIRSDPENFFAMVYQHLVREGHKRYAFLIDWSHYLFGNAEALSEQERQWLLILAKAIRNAPVDFSLETVSKPRNVVILLCNSLDGIPLSYYQNNDLVKEIGVPIPGRRERQEFLKRNLALFRLQGNVTVGTPAFNDFVDALDGFTLREIQQLIRLSRQVDEALTFEKLVNLYRYGEKTSPWVSSTFSLILSTLTLRPAMIDVNMLRT